MKTSVKTKNTKPAYSTWQNTIHVIQNTWKWDAIVLWVMLTQMAVSVAISTVWIFLPAAVVNRITNGDTVRSLVFTILAFTAGLVILGGLQTYFSNNTWYRRRLQSIRIGFLVRDKVIETDYANLEMQNFSDARQKAQNNAAYSTNYYFILERLGTNILGFFVYLFLLAAVNPFVVALSAATSLLGVIARHLANRWRYLHDDEEAAFNKRIFYVNYMGQQYSMGKDVRLFKMFNWIKTIFDKNIDEAFKFNRRAETRQWAADICGALGNFALDGIAYAYLIRQVLMGYIAVDTFVLLLAAVYGFSGWVSGILGELSTLNNASLQYCRIREFLNYPDSFKREEGESIAPNKNASYSFELENVSLRYAGAAENTLENINLHIKHGENLAVVGLNGAGKTTLVKLLCGFYDATEGTVKLNGRDIRDFNRKDYYRLFTAVFQDFNIMPNTIAENIAQETGDNIDMEKVNKCLELADLSEKIASLPNGVHSLLVQEVNQDAVALSGGETQKLMLARALYKDAPILILDEPTAALDPIAESRMYERYHELSEGRTSIYISHRLASTRFCDRIILVDNKGIAEMGTHEELMARNTQYAKLFEIQSKYYKEGVDKWNTI